MQDDYDIGSSASSEVLMSEEENPKNENKLIIKILAAVIITASVLGLFYLFASKAQEKIDSYYAVVFSKQGEEFFESSKGGFKLKEYSGRSPLISKDSKTLFYFTPSKTISNKLDLYCCDLTSRQQIKKGGFIVDSGVGSDISVNNNGSYMIYSKKNETNGEIAFYLFNTKKKNSTKFESNIKDLFILHSENGVFYTKIKDSKTALYKYSFYDESKLISESVKKANFFYSDSQDVLVYETFEEDPALFSLNIIEGLGESTLISSAVTDVLYDHYVAGGNLYYFKAGAGIIGWEAVINDDLKEKDEQISQPNPDDYTFIFGYSYQYRKAVTEYQAKIVRDELRASIERTVIMEDLISKGVDCYSYDTGGSFVVALGASVTKVFSVSTISSPCVVYEKYAYKNSEATFSDLEKMMKKKNIAEATNYAIDIIKDATASVGVHLATKENTEGTSLNISNVEAQDSKFGFSKDGTELFVVIEDANVFESTFFKFDITGKTVSRREVIDSNISNIDFSGDTVWYLKPENESGDATLYVYAQGNKKQVINSVFSFICFDDEDTLIFRNKKQNQSGLSADLYVYKGESCVLIDENIDLHKLRYKNANDLTYIKGYTEETGGVLSVYVNEKVSSITDGVTSIILF
jgi:hypothetical protein